MLCRGGCAERRRPNRWRTGGQRSDGAVVQASRTRQQGATSCMATCETSHMSVCVVVPGVRRLGLRGAVNKSPACRRSKGASRCRPRSCQPSQSGCSPRRGRPSRGATPLSPPTAVCPDGLCTRLLSVSRPSRQTYAPDLAQVTCPVPVAGPCCPPTRWRRSGTAGSR